MGLALIFVEIKNEIITYVMFFFYCHLVKTIFYWPPGAKSTT